MRARLALKLSKQKIEIREILLKDKPAEMLAMSSKGTVPVLVYSSEKVIDESIDIAHWALKQNDPEHYLPKTSNEAELTKSLIQQCDGEFKYYLDRYKYFDRYPEFSQQHYHLHCEAYLETLIAQLNKHNYLISDSPCLADIAIFPFIRQFAMVDSEWFRQSVDPKLINWLDYFLESALFKSIMKKYPVWQTGQAPIYL